MFYDPHAHYDTTKPYSVLIIPAPVAAGAVHSKVCE